MNNEELLICNTTKEQRIRIVNESLGINVSFKTEYVMGDDSARPEKDGCGMGMF